MLLCVSFFIAKQYSTRIIKITDGNIVSDSNKYKTTDDKAYILTNHHVIEQSDEVRVVFTNNETEEEFVGGGIYGPDPRGARHRS